MFLSWLYIYQYFQRFSQNFALYISCTFLAISMRKYYVSNVAHKLTLYMCIFVVGPYIAPVCVCMVTGRPVSLIICRIYLQNQLVVSPIKAFKHSFHLTTNLPVLCIFYGEEIISHILYFQKANKSKFVFSSFEVSAADAIWNKIMFVVF